MLESYILVGEKKNAYCCLLKLGFKIATWNTEPVVQQQIVCNSSLKQRSKLSNYWKLSI